MIYLLPWICEFFKEKSAWKQYDYGVVVAKWRYMAFFNGYYVQLTGYRFHIDIYWISVNEIKDGKVAWKKDVSVNYTYKKLYLINILTKCKNVSWIKNETSANTNNITTYINRFVSSPFPAIPKLLCFRNLWRFWPKSMNCVYDLQHFLSTVGWKSWRVFSNFCPNNIHYS